ncbi:MAG: hypothetical protein R2757_12250 [Draconibacterium sp.]
MELFLNRFIPGLENGQTKHIHGEMDRVLKEEVDDVIEKSDKKLNAVWRETIDETLDNYLEIFLKALFTTAKPILHKVLPPIILV